MSGPLPTDTLRTSTPPWATTLMVITTAVVSALGARQVGMPVQHVQVQMPDGKVVQAVPVTDPTDARFKALESRVDLLEVKKSSTN